MNIVIIISDTLRRDHLGCYGNRWIKTPSIEKLAEQAVVFDRAYSASFPTVPARRDIFTGRFTYTYSTWAPVDAYREEVLLSQCLSKAGYNTMLVADTPHFLRDGYNFQKGFKGWKWIRGQENDNYITDTSIDVKLPCNPDKLRDPDFTVVQYLRNISQRQYEEDYFVARTMRMAGNWLEKNYRSKFFLYVDTFDPHEPLDPPRWYRELYNPGYKGEEVIYPRYWYVKDFLTIRELNHCRALYAAEVSLVDRWVGELLRKIEYLGIWNETVIIFTTDHGFCHGEHGIMGKALLDKERKFSFMPLYEEICHIPFIVYLPGIKPGRCLELVQLTDIMPTILELLKIENPETMQGKSILPLLEGRKMAVHKFAVSSPTIIFGAHANPYTTITTKQWSLILTAEREGEKIQDTKAVDGISKRGTSIGRYESCLYDLSADPFQKRNIIRKNRDIARKLHLEYIEFLRSIGTKDEYIQLWQTLKL